MEHIETKLANEIALEYEDEEDSDDGHMMIPLNEEEADLYRSVFNMLDTKKKVWDMATSDGGRPNV